MKQRTLVREVSVRGKGLHSGEDVTLTLKPADPGTGHLFRRIDLYGKPEIRADIRDVSLELIRQTSLVSGHHSIHTPEHVLSALYGCGVDNCILELDASEIPILDGSARGFVNLIQEAETVEQEPEREYIELQRPISVNEGNRSLIALPHDGFRVTCTSADDRGIHTQHLSIDINEEQYIAQLAPARTFTIYEDIEELLRLGKIQGGSLDSAIVIKGDKILSREPLRFKDEFVRHKIVDVVGDLSLLGRPLKAHIIAVRPGHSLNSQLAREIRRTLEEESESKPARKAARGKPEELTTIKPEENFLDIRRVLQILPHRFPFVMIDRVLGFEDGEGSVTALKNVSINEPYFPGHFPGHPVMPGVLQLEAMAQTAGLLMLKKIESAGKVAFFMSADKVKFRRTVTPGDQVVIKAKIIRTRGKTMAACSCSCEVDGKTVSSAELMFAITEVDAEI